MRIVGAVLFVLLLSSVSFSGDLETVKSFKDMAAKGDVYAPFAVGVCYRDGDGIRKDLKEATKWFQLGMERGDPLAASTLGDMYLAGEGVPKNPKKAIECFYRGAKGEGVYANSARIRLIVMARDYAIGGNGVIPDKTMAKLVFERLLEVERISLTRDQQAMEESYDRAKDGFDKIRDEHHKAIDEKALN